MELLMSAALLGLGGSLHCVGMCGPLALLVGAKKRSHLFMYHVMRLLGYALVGGLFGFFGKQLQNVLGREVVGYIILGFAGVILLSIVTNFHTWSITQRVSRRFSMVQQSMMKLTPMKRAMGMGLSTVLLPCGLLYAAFLLAISAPNWWMGAGAMSIFAIASSPALWVGQELIRSIRERLSPQHQRWIQQGLSLVALYFLVKMGWKAITVPADMAMHHHHGHGM
jgi:sulfite exporter TauE/SafE